jgi:hypothetical protein
MKDFLFFNYSWVWGSTTYFKYFEKMGHTIDIVDENTIFNFNPNVKYKNVVVYLHEPHQLQKINHLLNDQLSDSFLIQHDDTDEEQLQRWTLKTPDLFMHRELTDNTVISTTSPVIPFHFPMNSIYDENINEKPYDVSFIGNMTNPRRRPFVDHILKLSQTTLSHLNWYIDVDGANYKPGFATENFRKITNQSKIGIHYFGNSYDSIRIWEILSCKTALLMPKMRSHSVDKYHMELKNYQYFNDDYSDLEEKINFLLDGDRYKDLSLKGHEEYKLNHNIDKCCEYYYNSVMKFARK